MFAETTNTDRAEWALCALGDFVNRTGVDDPADAIGDLMTDLLHLARFRGLDPEALLQRAAGAFAAEIVEDGDGEPDNIVRLFREMVPDDIVD